MGKGITADQRRLLCSFFLFGLASPMVLVYANTFLWRQDHDPITLAIFNIGMYAGISLGFLLNAYALRWWQSGRLYTMGCVLQGAMPVLLVSMGASATQVTLPLGVALGIAQGFFWANRNSITSRYTVSEHRFRFVSLETTLGIIAGIVSPLAIGWFIGLGETLPFYTVAQAYQWSAVVGSGILLISGALVWGFTIEPLAVRVPYVQKASPRWNRQRLMELLNGIHSGAEAVVPLLLVLLFLGQEEAVGTIKAVTGILSALLIYLLGSRVRQHHHIGLVALWVLANAAGAMMFAIVFSIEAAIAYFLVAGLVASLRWSSFVTVMYEVIDREVIHDGGHRFIYLLDREWFLNAGRVIGLLLFLAAYLASPNATIRFGLLAMYVIQVPVLLLLQWISRGLEHKQVAIGSRDT